MSGPLAPDLARALGRAVAAPPAAPAPPARAHLDAVFAGLNEPQRAAASWGEGPLLVVAGPGAGKTRAIVARVAYLRLARGVAPRQVMAITFSRRAAGELQSRLAATLPAGEDGGVWAGTFHALGARILRRGGARHFDRPDTFTIYDRDDTERALKRIIASLDVPPGVAGRVLVPARQAISLAKRRAEAPEGALVVGDVSVPLDEVYRQYAGELREALAFDFDDLVGLAAQALERDPALREQVQRFARHLLVDEYQDTDPAQEALLRGLLPPPHNLCVVADPQQSIYAFRGAVPEQVQRFLERWPGAGVIRLEQNYRSTKSIVGIARRLVAPFSAAVARRQTREAGRLALGLRLWTDNPPGEAARLWVAPHPEKEAGAIAADVAARIAGGWAPEEVAILVRTHAQARPLEAALLRAQVPYVLVGGVRFYAREEVKDALAYLRIAALPDDTAAFWRIVNTPRRGLGPAALLTIARHTLAGAGGPLVGARRWAAGDAAPDGLYDLLAHVDELAALERSGAGPRAVVEAALTLTGYREYVKRQHPEDAAARLETLDELVRIAGGYRSARRFLDEAALSSEEDDQAPAGGKVRLSTVHAAKGLEFRAVYVPGCEYGLFPLVTAQRGTRDGDAAGAAGDAETARPSGGGEFSTDVTHHFAPGADPEERRVFYVAVTRAKEALTLSYCTFRRDARTQPSPYVSEIGRGLLRRARLGTSEPPPARTRRRPPRPAPDA